MSTTQETTIERSPVLLKLRVDDAGNQHVDASYHTLSAGNDYYDGKGGIGLAGCMSKEQADYIVRACNNHEALVEALTHAADMLSGAARAFDSAGNEWMASNYSQHARKAQDALANPK